MSTILNTGILNGLFEIGDLKVFKCSKSGSFKNFFFSPNISIKLYNGKVTWIDGHSVSFCFNKYATIENNTITVNETDSMSVFSIFS